MKGVAVILFALNRQTLCKQNSIEDVLLIKDMNMNAVRMSHYPPDDHFLVFVITRLFVMDELQLAWSLRYTYRHNAAERNDDPI